MARYGINRALSEGYDGMFHSNLTLTEEIKDNVVNWLRTNHYERIMRPMFGANLKSFLFQPLNEELNEIVSDRILTGLNKYFPYVNVVKLSLESTDQTLTVRMILDYNGNTINIDEVIGMVENG